MLTIYGIPNSQPVRAVIWPCLIKQLPFELRLTSQNRDAKRPQYLAEVNPRGTVPAIDDDGFVLWESHAILIYLSEKHGWTDLYPDDLLHRAKVNQYLHFHHRNTRELVVQWSRALWPTVFAIDDPDEHWLDQNTFTGSKNNAEASLQALAVLEEMLERNEYLTGERSTLADISAYEELGQNQPKYANCTSFQAYPKIRRWLSAMAAIPHHDTAHQVWELIGDVRKVTGGMRTIAAANKTAAKTIAMAVSRPEATT